MDDITVQEILSVLGVGRRFLGFTIATDAIHLAYRDETALLRCKSDIIKPLAAKYGCSCSAIERNLRTVIHHAWLTTPKHLQRMAVYPLPEPPGVVEFIDIIITYLHRRHRRNL